MTRLTVVVSSAHELGLVSSPGRAQVLLGQADKAPTGPQHAAQAFGPTRQRCPPQIGPIGPAGSGQSALVKQDWLFPLLQV